MTIPDTSLSVISSDDVRQILNSRLFGKAFKNSGIKYTEIKIFPLNNIHKSFQSFSMQ